MAGEHQAPPAGTVERWAWDYINGRDLALKRDPPAPPELWEDRAPVRRLDAPGRPPQLEPASRAPKTPRPGALRDPAKRAQLLHTFWHHELQAAELMCWALLAFPEAEPEFRRGLMVICQDELRHMRMYAEHLERLDCPLGAHPVRDWFWMRVPQCPTPLAFVSLVGIGLEAGNLDHAARFADWFEAAGDLEGAELQRVVGREEERHVQFAAYWFARWAGELDFERWRDNLVPPLTPKMLRAPVMNLPARLRAGLSQEFIDKLVNCDQGRSD